MMSGRRDIAGARMVPATRGQSVGHGPHTPLPTRWVYPKYTHTARRTTLLQKLLQRHCRHCCRPPCRRTCTHSCGRGLPGTPDSCTSFCRGTADTLAGTLTLVLADADCQAHTTCSHTSEHNIALVWSKMMPRLTCQPEARRRVQPVRHPAHVCCSRHARGLQHGCTCAWE
eukprot:1153796-Pelagomonas_calceolata.AAC.4